MDGMKIDTKKIAACILDMDGIMTDTARLHAKAWKRIFDEFLKKRDDRSEEKLQPFDPDKDYRDFVDGKPRYDGVASFLDSRRLSLPRGDADDSSEKETVCIILRIRQGKLVIKEDEKINHKAPIWDIIRCPGHYGCQPEVSRKGKSLFGRLPLLFSCSVSTNVF